MMKIFWDSEFTGLHQNTTLISIGFITETDETFYAEFVDYDKSQIDEWLQFNVLNKLKFGLDIETGFTMPLGVKEFNMKGDKPLVKEYLLKWFEQFNQIELWSDCLSYDWVLLFELIANRSNEYPKLPSNFSYHSPYDILTLFKIKEIDPDINRESFAYGSFYAEMPKHNSLWDAQIIKACYERLVTK